MRCFEKGAARGICFAWMVLALAAILAFVPCFAFAEEAASPTGSAEADAVAAEQQSACEGADVKTPDPDSGSYAAAAQKADSVEALDSSVVAKEGEDDAGAPTDSEGDEGEEPSAPVQPVEPVVPGLKTVGDRIQYINNDGSLVKSDWRLVAGKYYYFDSKGNAVRWNQKIGDQWYYFDGKCVMQKGWIIWKADGTKSYFGSDGAAVLGWQNIGGKRYYFNPSTGKSFRWNHVIDGETYYFNGDSSMHTGLLTWKADGLKSYYGPDGKRLTGWQKSGGKTYYIDPATGKSVRWQQKIGGSWYYFDGDSSMHTGLLTWKADGLKGVYGPDGKRLTGWQEVKGETYYINPSTGKSVRYRQKINGSWYYFNANSQMHTGWLKWNGKKLWSYYWSNGVGAVGTYNIGGYNYTFDINGYTTTEPITIPPAQRAMSQKAQGYSSSTNYLILVNRGTHKVGIFERKSGRWDMTAYWDCVTGAPSTPTITGSFKTTGGKRSSLSTDSRAKYCTQITGGYFFHTILASNNELGKSLSHGCIRMSYSSAKWIYQHINAGTRVVIY